MPEDWSWLRTATGSFQVSGYKLHKPKCKDKGQCENGKEQNTRSLEEFQKTKNILGIRRSEGGNRQRMEQKMYLK